MARAGLDPAVVVRAAGELADAEGLGRLTLVALAERLHVRPPSLYAHVAGLDDVRARLAVDGYRRLTAVLSQAAAGRAGADALRAVADAYRAFAQAHPGVYAAMQRAPDPAEGEAVRAASEAVDVVGAVLRGYGLAGDDAIHGVRIVRSALHGFVSLEAEGGFGMPIAPQQTWERLIAMLDRGLASSP